MPLNPELNGILKISGFDKYNADLDKEKQTAINERHHREMLEAQNNNISIAREANNIAREANTLSEESNKISQEANRKSKCANLIAIISSVIALGSLVASIIALCH